ncbi:hypothetical protein K438DRAFT_1974400 [Mycena galopus ATCC 62051]|nr:hypothetical protein K438DRAFT_1974400 [Mycena galopus ATCC 62051]
MNPADPKDSRQSRQAEKRGRLNCDDEEMSEDENRNAELALAAAAVIPLPISQAEIHGSDDELDNWDTVDESNIVSPMKTAKAEKTQSLNSPPARCTPQPPSSSKQSSNRKRGSQLQFQTPPRSRTPSFADDVPTPIVSVSPPSSPLPPLRSSSRKKSKPMAVPKPVDRFISQVRTRTQSRPPTDKLDLVAASRGRSASRRLVTRTSISEPAESVEGSTSSKKLGLPSSNRSAGTSKTKVSPSSKTVGVSPNSKRLGSVEQLPRAAFGKRKERHREGELIARDRKGKGRASDVEERLVDVDRERDDSDDPLGLPPSPTPPYRPGGRGHRRSVTTATKEKQNSHSRSTKRSPLPRFLEPLQTSTKKRKRKSSSSDGEESAQHADFNRREDMKDMTTRMSELAREFGVERELVEAVVLRLAISGLRYNTCMSCPTLLRMVQRTETKRESKTPRKPLASVPAPKKPRKVRSLSPLSQALRRCARHSRYFSNTCKQSKHHGPSAADDNLTRDDDENGPQTFVDTEETCVRPQCCTPTFGVQGIVAVCTTYSIGTQHNVESPNSTYRCVNV